MSELPKYLVRPDDFVVFSINEDSTTYSVKKSKEQWPDRLHHKYSYDVLKNVGFFESDDKEVQSGRFEELCKLYHKSFRYDNDGHGDEDE